MDREEVERVHKHAKKKKKKKKKEEEGQYPAILTDQVWSIKKLLYGTKHQKVIFVCVCLPELKGKPVKCKNQWCVLLYPDWVNAEIQSFDWFTFERGIV